MSNAPLSGIPPEAWLSGLPLGSLLGGMGEPSLSGGEGVGGQQAGGMTGGLSLDELTALLGMDEQIGPGTFAAPFGGLGDFSLGQGAGGFQAGGVPAGTPQHAQSGYVQAGGQREDPLMLIKQALGLVKTGTGLGQQVQRVLGAGGGYATEGQPQQGIDPTGFSLTDAGGPASPVNALLEGLGQGGQGALTGTNSFTDPSLGSLFTRGLMEGSIDPSWVSGLGPEDQQQLLSALLTGQEGPLLGAGGMSLGVSPVGYGTGTAPQSSPDTNFLGAAGGGVSGLLGLLNLYQGLQGGNPQAAVGGGLQGAGGLLSLLQNSPGLAGQLGLSGVLTPPDPSLAGGGGLDALGGTSLALYSALGQLFPEVFPSVGSLFGMDSGGGGRRFGFNPNPVDLGNGVAPGTGDADTGNATSAPAVTGFNPGLASLALSILGAGTFGALSPALSLADLALTGHGPFGLNLSQVNPITQSLSQSFPMSAQLPGNTMGLPAFSMNTPTGLLGMLGQLFGFSPAQQTIAFDALGNAINVNNLLEALQGNTFAQSVFAGPGQSSTGAKGYGDIGVRGADTTGMGGLGSTGGAEPGAGSSAAAGDDPSDTGEAP